MHVKYAAIGLVLSLILCSSAVIFSDDSDAEQFDEPVYGDFLIDYGNGSTEWVDIKSGPTVEDTVIATLSSSGHVGTCTPELSVDGIATTVMGSTLNTGADLAHPGTSGSTVTCRWNVYSWDEVNSAWQTTSLSDAYTDQILAIGYYPTGMAPVETPEFKSSWTMIEADAENSANQTAILDNTEPKVKWSYEPKRPGSASGVYGAILYAQGYSFVKYGWADGENNVYLTCYNTETGDEVWTFKYPASAYETTTPVLAGEKIFIQSSKGFIYTFEWNTGPGIDNANVKSFYGADFDSATPIPNHTVDVIGQAYGSGPTSMVFDSGCLFTKSSNGMIYCFDSDLNLLWAYQTGGNTYFSAPTVHGNYVAAGFYDGNLYILDKQTGSLVTQTTVFRTIYKDTPTGCANVPMFIETDAGCTVFISYSDGRGMSASTYGMAVYSFDGSALTLLKDYRDTLGSVSTYFTKMNDGIIFSGAEGTYFMDCNGEFNILGKDIKEENLTHAAYTLVNGKYLLSSTYPGNTHKVFLLDLNGTILGERVMPVKNYCMAPVVVVDGYILCGNDSGAFCFSGDFDEYVRPSKDEGDSNLWLIIYTVTAIIVILTVLWCVLRFGLKWDKPFRNLKMAIYSFLYGEQYSHNKRSRHRLLLIMAIGISLTLVIFILSLCLGSETTLGPGDALSAAVSSIQKGGKGLSYEEMLIYNSRLPRGITAIAVGIGLSVAGAVYQAVIKNPLVEPYIMGVSSGAGTLAIAVIAYDFTFFGLFSSNNTFLTAISAIVGGLLAFALTMILATKTGGKSTNYVLAGIVIGLVFSAVQSLMMIMAGNNIASSLSWLYGSFTSITWEKLWIVLIPVLALSCVPLVWAKELNLVLLGDDQAKLMGLNAERFNRFMLIIASILTAFCVAFCGIIGFVGLVIPHLCRMILGGDHRLMLPASMAFGGFIMISADLLARILITGYELPVGAITTVIGVPVFAYLLVRRGKSYDM